MGIVILSHVFAWDILTEGTRELTGILETNLFEFVVACLCRHEGIL